MEPRQSRLIQDALSLDGNRLGLLDFNSRSCTSTDKKRRRPLDMDGILCLENRPFGLFPNSVKEGDGVCILMGFLKIYICWPVKKSEGEDEGQYLTIIGECYVNDQYLSVFSESMHEHMGEFYSNELREFPTTDFIFH
jgi:hypothetical protein